MKQIHISQLMPLVETALPDLTDWTVGFVKVIETSSGDVEGVLAGSGVLVNGNGLHAILTADHVRQALPNSGPVGLVMLTRRGLIDHQFILEMQYVQKLTIGKSRESESGPDLALLVLSNSDVNRIQARKLFHNLDKRKERMLAQPRADQIGPWVMCGLIGEMTKRVDSSGSADAPIGFKGLCGPVVLSGIRKDSTFDYFSAEVNFGKSHDLPESYGGWSGSGVWRLEVVESDKTFSVKDISLGGIAFYESAPRRDHRYIECHGIKSIYENVLDALKGS